MIHFLVLVYVNVPGENRKAPPRKPSTFGCDRELYPSLPECKEAVHRCLRAWGVETGETNVSRSAEAFRRRLLQGHVLERCAKRVKDLTDRIVKMDAYPAAYGGFNDVWSCQLRYKQKPPKRVGPPGMGSFQRTILIIALPQVAVKAIRPAIASKEEYQVKKKVTPVRDQALS